MKFIPHEYQKTAIKKVLNTPRVGLFLDMGLGKTVITLTAINELMYHNFEINKVLIIAPLRVAESTWSEECQKWEHLKHIKINKVLGGEMTRHKALYRDADIYIINRENVPWLAKEIAGGLAWDFDMVVIDELSSFTNGIRRDIAAVKNAISFDYNNGLAEGSVNKLKVVKRIMYGRNSFELLKGKLLRLELRRKIN